MDNKQIFGTGVALITPFKADLSIDFKALEQIILSTIHGGVNFIVALGTTAETSMLSLEERRSVISFIKEKVDGRVPVVLGYGGISTMEMISSFGQYDYDGIDALLTVTPFYVKPSQAGLYAHYTAIADAAPRPVILYNVPGRTGVNMEASTTLRLAEHENIIGVKEASGRLFQAEEILMDKPRDFLLFSGDDAMTFHFMNLGADGVISVMANAYPMEVSAVVNGVLDRDTEDALRQHYLLKDLTKAIFADGNPSGIKYLLSRLGKCENQLRLPLVPVCDATAARIDECLNSIDALQPENQPI